VRIIAPLTELGQVVGKAGFLVEFALESMTVYAGENQVSAQRTPASPALSAAAET
jgi:hypothetical protein